MARDLNADRRCPNCGRLYHTSSTGINFCIKCDIDPDGEDSYEAVWDNGSIANMGDLCKECPYNDKYPECLGWCDLMED